MRKYLTRRQVERRNFIHYDGFIQQKGLRGLSDFSDMAIKN